jgi:NAD(P)-dependent dehydrogenase (short-subunit alcohol dehydrogenase family)
MVGDVGRFSGKVALVTGAAQGIGEALSRQLAAEGARVLAVDVNMGGATRVAAAICGDGGEAEPFWADITRSAEVEAFVEYAVGSWGRLDILVNNASNVAAIGAADGDVVSTSMDTWDVVFACNLRGPAAACKFAIPHMIANGGGAIVNIASVQGLAGDVTRCAYGATKAGLVMLSKYIATSFGRHGVRCNSVAPGMVMTPSALDPSADVFLGLVEASMTSPTRGQPADLAEIVAFLVSDAARYVTGQNLTADGGLTCHLPWYADLQRALPPAPPSLAGASEAGHE